MIQYINSKLPSHSEHAHLFIYIESEIIAHQGVTMAQLYQEYREDDYFLYLAYYEENHYQQLVQPLGSEIFDLALHALCVMKLDLCISVTRLFIQN